MLRVEAVTHAFGFDTVLSDVSLSVAEGETLSLVGPSGCGKTTLLSMCAGLLSPTEGRVENGFRRTAMVFQDDRLLPWRLAWQNIAFGLKARGAGRARCRRAAFDLARRLRLSEADLHKYPHELSGGMRQRIALGRALAVDPDLLLLDEPFNALDIGLRRELQDLVLDLIRERGLTAVFITHDLLEAVRVSSRILVFRPDPGRIVREVAVTLPPGRRDDDAVYQRVAALLADSDVRAAFGLAPEAAA